MLNKRVLTAASDGGRHFVQWLFSRRNVDERRRPNLLLFLPHFILTLHGEKTLPTTGLSVTPSLYTITNITIKMQTADWLFMMKCNSKVPGRPFCSGSSQARLGLQAIAIVGSTAKIHPEQKNLMMKTAAAAEKNLLRQLG